MTFGEQLSASLLKLQQLQAAGSGQRPEPVGSPRPVRLSIGIATYDDYDGAFFTIESLRLHHAAELHDAEILLLDNHPGGPESEALMRMFERQSTPNLRYLPFDAVQSTAVREVLLHEAVGEVVVILDTHVLLAPGALTAVWQFFTNPAHARDLVHGPLLRYDANSIAATHMKPEFVNGMFGTWDRDPRGVNPNGEPFEIELSGLGAFAVRRSAWPGINPRFRGFGGEEGYLHEKIRLAGGRVFCLPAFRWIHRFERPRGVPYPNVWEDRINNYRIGWAEVGYDLEAVHEHFAAHLGSAITRVWSKIDQLIDEPARLVDGFVVESNTDEIAAWQRNLAALTATSSQWIRAEFGELDDTPIPRSAARAQALRQAWCRGWRSVALFDAGQEPSAEQLRAWGTAASKLAKNLEIAADVILIRDLSALTDADRIALDLDLLPAQFRELKGTEMNTNPTRVAAVEQSDLKDGAVLFDPATQVAHHLNPTAMLVWELIDGREVSGIVDELVTTLELDRTEAESWVASTLEAFRQQRLIQ